MSEEIIRDFPVTVYGNLEKYNEVISKGRCRIFYKGANRNSTFITDEFAEKLMATISYTPIKGIYNDEEQDFTDHGERRNLGRIYGVVPAEPNFKWEKHLDEDGVEREYACVDVLYYTGLYGEASIISGKSQSMELYSKSIKGDWKILNGKRYYVYEDACFLGLQALGDDVEPCFEGAAFYSLFESMKKFIDEIHKYNENFQNNGQGGHKMPNNLFKLSDSQKATALWELLNSEVTEDGYRVYCYAIMDVYDDYAIAYNYADEGYERVYYTKDDATDSVSITEKKKCFILDVTEAEKNVLENLRHMNGDTYEKADEVFGSIEGLNNQISELSTKNVELIETVATLSSERDSANSQLETVNADFAKAKEDIESLVAEKEALSAYKKNVEDQAKLEVINSYSDSLSDEVLDNYRNNLDSYNIDTLDMELTYEQKKANPNMFQKQVTPTARIPKDEQVGGIESILAKYERK